MSVIIDGVDLTEDLGLKVLADTSDEMLPDVQNYSVNIPGRHGEYSFNSWMQPRKFSLDILIPPQASRMDVQVIAREFNRLLLDRFGNPKEVTLSFDFEPDKHYNVKLTSAIDIERKLRMGFFTAELTAYDPFAYASMSQYDPKEDVIYGEVENEDYYANTAKFDWIYERHYSGIYNYSPFETDFIIEIEGSVSEPKVTNLVNNETLTLPSLVNDKLVVDSKRFLVLKNGRNAFSETNANFFNIQPGEVGFLFEGENPNARVNYKWLHKFM